MKWYFEMINPCSPRSLCICSGTALHMIYQWLWFVLIPHFHHAVHLLCSNAAYALLAHCLIGKLHPLMTYESYIQKFILQPLNMNNTGFKLTERWALSTHTFMYVMMYSLNSGPPTGWGGNLPWASPCWGPQVRVRAPATISKRDQNTLMEWSNSHLLLLSEKYSVDNYSEISCWNCSHIQSQRSSSQKFYAIRKFLYTKYCDYCWNDSVGLILKIFPGKAFKSHI